MKEYKITTKTTHTQTQNKPIFNGCVLSLGLDYTIRLKIKHNERKIRHSMAHLSLSFISSACHTYTIRCHCFSIAHVLRAELLWNLVVSFSFSILSCEHFSPKVIYIHDQFSNISRLTIDTSTQLCHFFHGILVADATAKNTN